MLHNSANLLKKIELLRNRMTHVALDKGFTSTESVLLSQELDKLLNLYEEYKMKDKINDK
ncbi:aspartyl-phosphate phosphatase Spo0E family protein [Aquibacillus rhizosphaerae]|uniref:Aspartyl-phosphate phosphatase Spo0E family protein n=1 Tax=Aquibacillus rhizosphaerae TaxID=3051431 RepID=A0ABT7LA89_9BACI|nr:aspartyl-phosphate phosphatase Spo0E family protein [Aquibacillus sp. LR5S19]MDL4842167.1 aspartyl-phosphate phosphatase Spo0E family protein [Aquibacillus sp. LR5S19]